MRGSAPALTAHLVRSLELRYYFSSAVTVEVYSVDYSSAIGYDICTIALLTLSTVHEIYCIMHECNETRVHYVTLIPSVARC